MVLVAVGVKVGWAAVCVAASMASAVRYTAVGT
jgi:hypothetical protein